jgi:ProP effector
MNSIPTPSRDPQATSMTDATLTEAALDAGSPVETTIAETASPSPDVAMRSGAEREADAPSDAEADAAQPAPALPGGNVDAPAPAVGAAPSMVDAGPQLRKLFPALFGNPPKPLKLQIQHDIQARAPGVFSKKALSAFFRRYTGSHSYLNAVAHGKNRFDLDGAPAGELSAEHRQVAVDELARRRANHTARIELEEQQRRNRAGLLHDFQTTTLTAANFCALKGVAVEELDGLLELARREADERAQQMRAPDPRRQPGRPPATARRR